MNNCSRSTNAVLASAIAVALYTLPVTGGLESGEANALSLKRFEKNLRRETNRATRNVGRELGRVQDSVERDAGRAVSSIEREGDRAIKNAERTGDRVVEAADVFAKTVERNVRRQRNSLEAAASAIADGNLDRAFKELTVRNIEQTSQILSRGFQDSSYLRALGQTAATAYGGPGGAAAFSGWFTYEVTGDFDAAFRTSMVSGVSSAIGQSIAVMPSESIGDAVARGTVAGGSAYTLAKVAGASGSQAEKAFMMSIGQQVAIAAWELGTNANRPAEDSETRFEYDRMKVATDRGYCSDTSTICAPPEHLRREGGYRRDIAALGVNKVGFQASSEVLPEWWDFVGPAAKDFWFAENGPVMSYGFGRIPMFNAMATFHDEWMMRLGEPAGPVLVGTIIPSIIVTYGASGAQLQRAIEDAVIEDVSQQAQAMTDS